MVTTTEEEFHKHRTMFYLDEVNIPVYPEEPYKNMSHAEWFNIIGVNIETTIRGYLGDSYVHLYIGEHFGIPFISSLDLAHLAALFTVDTVKLGCKKGKVGEPWDAFYEFKRIK